MNEALIENWNNTVSDDDLVYVIGDVCMGKIADSLPLCGRLKGHKRLLLGNHDRPFPIKKGSEKWFEPYGEYFEDIRLTEVIEIAGEKVLLSHFPSVGDSGDSDRFEDFRPEFDGWILHGHTHSHNFEDYRNKQIHVGVDSEHANYSPIPLIDIQHVIEGG